MNHQADVAVVGVGSIGSMALWRLAARGIDVHGFEQFGVPHDRSAAGGETRMFRSTSPREPIYVEFARRSLALWRELEDEARQSLLTLNGELVLGPKDDPYIGNILDSIAAFDLEHDVLGHSEIAERYPQHSIGPGDIGILDPNAGFLRSELAVLAAARRAEAHGAVVHRATPVVDVRPGPDAVEVVTSQRTFRYRRVVVAGGPWSERLLPELRDKIQVRRPIQAWFAVDDPARYEPESFPIALRPTDDGFYGFPSLDGVSIKLGPAALRKQVVDDPDRLDRTVGMTELEALCHIVRDRLPGLHPDPVRVAAYMDGYTADNRPIAGWSRHSDRIVVLAGFSGLGFKYAPAFGETAAELITEADPTFDLEPFSTRRSLVSWS